MKRKGWIIMSDIITGRRTKWAFVISFFVNLSWYFMNFDRIVLSSLISAIIMSVIISLIISIFVGTINYMFNSNRRK